MLIASILLENIWFSDVRCFKGNTVEVNQFAQNCTNFQEVLGVSLDNFGVVYSPPQTPKLLILEKKVSPKLMVCYVAMLQKC